MNAMGCDTTPCCELFGHNAMLSGGNIGILRVWVLADIDNCKEFIV